MPKNTFFNLDIKKQKKIIESSMSEFSSKIYEQVNISDIIKKSDIPRGSFYQYFEDKKDLYLYLIDIIKNKKMEYLGNIYQESKGPFLDIVEKLFDQGIKFAIDHPDYVRIYDLLVNNKNEIYHQLIKDSMVYANDYYSDLINIDKAKGLLREDINTSTLANIITQLTTNITMTDLSSTRTIGNYDTMKENFHNLLDILKKGIENNG